MRTACYTSSSTQTKYLGSETDGTIGIVSKVPIPRQLVSVSVSIQAFFESRYQYRYRSRALSIFWKVLSEFLLSKVSVSISVPVQFHGISISIGLDVDWVWVSVSVSVSIQGPIKYQYQYHLEISGPVCLWYCIHSPIAEILSNWSKQDHSSLSDPNSFWTFYQSHNDLMSHWNSLYSAEL